MKTSAIILTVSTLFFNTVSKAQTPKTFFLGHSLVNHDMPNMVNKLSVNSGKLFSHNEHIINGAPLRYNWDNAASAETNPSTAASYTLLNTGGYTQFIVTEAVPLLGHLLYNDTYKYADSLYMYAIVNNPTIKYYIYETWHCNTTGTPAGCAWDNDDALLWRQRLTADLPKWEAIADSVNSKHPNSTYIIPAGQALAMLNDSIDAGLIPGLTSFMDLFQDDIHLTNTGNYFIACLMYGVIHNESPEGLTNLLGDNWGGTYASFPTTSQAAAFQRIAWRTLCNYTRSGVNCSTIVTSNKDITTKKLIVYPNPANNNLTIYLNENTDEIKTIEISNAIGTVLNRFKTTQKELNIDVSEYNNGAYNLKITTNNQSYRKLISVQH